MVSDEEILWAYKAVLGREPEGPSIYEYHRAHETFFDLRTALISSQEGSCALRKYISLFSDQIFSFYQNMIVFLHIPKSGGTALNFWLCQVLGLPHVRFPHKNYLHNYTLYELNQLSYLSGHFSYEEAMAMPRAEKKIVTVLRDPIERLISLYRFYRAHPVGSLGSDLLPLAREMNIKDFYRHPTVLQCHEVDNKYLRTLVDGSLNLNDGNKDRSKCLDLALARLLTINAVGITEQMHLSCDVIAHHLGLKNRLEPERLMVTDEIAYIDNSYDLVLKIEKNEELADIMRPLVAYDSIIYERAKGIFQNDLCRLGLSCASSRDSDYSADTFV